ncbi:VWA domain-containing protein [Luteimonas sp BLCC-B24]|uniref:vWA domain-containing protein n=1 Tax=Luteimonas sp. BLCC-B24 TaxID=3025317 RepID=UPI00234C03AC|nr:VWA domain-containing protein [Luteimonas sp. BLCC-B24]MDC7807718.1 VWA domain-containing protein [Luteimonas sp. BLCC-B24]
MSMLASAWDAVSSQFAWPWLLAAAPLPWIVRRWLPPARAGGDALRVPYAALPAAGRGGRAGLAPHTPWLLWLAWSLLCIAAARPQQWGPPEQPPRAARDLMLAVDLSGSMGETDMRLGPRVVDRLTAAKAVLADFLERRGGDRVGLIVFGQRAYAMTPLTLDRASVQQQLDDTVVGLAGRETAIGDAIGLAVKRLQDQPRSQRVLILLTDGVSNAGVLSPEKAAELARDAGVRVHTIAFGSDEGDLSMFGFRLPASSEPAIDEAALQAIADATGGRAFRARDTDALAGIYDEIDRLEPVERAGPALRPRIERYPVPLAGACALLLLAALPRRRLRTTAGSAAQDVAT